MHEWDGDNISDALWEMAFDQCEYCGNIQLNCTCNPSDLFYDGPLGVDYEPGERDE